MFTAVKMPTAEQQQVEFIDVKPLEVVVTPPGTRIGLL